MYDLIMKYANILYDRNLKSFGTVTTVKDIVSEVYAIGYSSEEDVVKVVRDVVFKEKRRLLALRQQRRKTELTGEKVCNECQLPKPVSEFYQRVDSRTGFMYLCNNCKECEKIRRFNYNSRKRSSSKSKGISPPVCRPLSFSKTA